MPTHEPTCDANSLKASAKPAYSLRRCILPPVIIGALLTGAPVPIAFALTYGEVRGRSFVFLYHSIPGALYGFVFGAILYLVLNYLHNCRRKKGGPRPVRRALRLSLSFLLPLLIGSLLGLPTFVRLMEVRNDREPFFTWLMCSIPGASLGFAVALPLCLLLNRVDGHRSKKEF